MTFPGPEIILYDLACTKHVCFSPVVWKIRLKLNYKGIPYETVFVEFPDIEAKAKELGLSPNAKGTSYTVPIIHHLPSNTTLMDSVPISQFIETTYPDPPVILASDLGTEIEKRCRRGLGPLQRALIIPREIRILSPRSQLYFREKSEAALGHPLEDLLGEEKEAKAWSSTEELRSEIGQLMLSNGGPFILGSTPCDTDFFIAGSLQSVRMIDEEIWSKYMTSGFKVVYEACEPYMDRAT